jgi:succinoglycan biosynthesis protein ExoM
LLGSLALQQGNFPPFDVVVVDNDAARSAAGVCADFGERLRLRYLVEPVRGIAPARNRAVVASTGRFIAFIDDDNEASANWLASLHKEAERQNADGVFGPVIFRFPQEPPAWIRHCGFFDYPPLADGAAVPWYWTRTSNAYVRRAALSDPGAPFDVSLGLVGGEDVDLFARMSDGGARLVAAREAVVYEYREAARTTARWLIRRSFRNGGTFAHVAWRRVRGAARLRCAAQSLGEFLASIAKAIRGLGHSRATAFQHGLRSIHSLGRAARAVGIVYSEYRRRA